MIDDRTAFAPPPVTFSDWNDGKYADIVYDWWEAYDEGMGVLDVSDKFGHDPNLIFLALMEVGAVSEDQPARWGQSARASVAEVLPKTVEQSVHAFRKRVFENPTDADLRGMDAMRRVEPIKHVPQESYNHFRAKTLHVQSKRERSQMRMTNSAVKAEMKAAGLLSRRGGMKIGGYWT